MSLAMIIILGILILTLIVTTIMALWEDIGWYSLILFPFVLLLTPFWYLFDYNSKKGLKIMYTRKKYNIHPLTEDNKTALLQMGFKYGEFSIYNIDYKGFSYKGLDNIIILENGKISIIGKPNEKDKYILEIILHLPGKDRVETEEPIKQ